MANSPRRGAAAVVAGAFAGVLALAIPMSGSSASPRPQNATPTVAITSLADGAAPFSAADGQGHDTAAANGRVRAGDVVRVGVRVTPNTAGDLVVDVAATNGVVAWSVEQPKGCLAVMSTVSCQLGPRPVGTPVDLVIEGRGAELTSAGDVAGSISVSTGGTPVVTPLVVTAGPPAVDAELRAPRFAGTTTRDGVDGVLVTYGLHLQSDATAASVSEPGGSTFDLLVDASGAGAGALVVACGANGEPGAGHVYGAAVSGRRDVPDVAASALLADGGAWSCTPDGARARVTAAAVDTNPDAFPTTAWDQTPLAPGAGVISAGTVTVFVPNDTVATSATAALSVSPVAGAVAGRANHGTCADADLLAAGTCGPDATRQDPLTTTSVGAPAPRLTVLHVVDQPVAAAATTLTWTTTLTNTGNVTLADVTAAVTPGGSTVAPAALAPGESWSFTTTGTQPEAGVTSTVAASGSPSGGAAITATASAVSTVPVTALSTTPEVVTIAADPFAVAQTPKTAITIYVNGVPFESGTGPSAIVGIANLIEYEIENLTASALTNIVVEDSTITNDATAIDCAEDTTNKNRIPTLAANDFAVCLRTVQPTSPATVAFTATTTINNVADASLNASYVVKSAVVDLELLVNGQDADSAPGPSVTVNSLLTFGYTIRNTGTLTLSGVYVSHVDDDDGVYSDISCATLGDDDDGDSSIDLMEPGQTVNCTFTPRAVAGAFSTTASVVAIPLSDDGEELGDEEGSFEITDEDALHYTGITSGGTTGGGTTGGGTTGGTTAPIVTQTTTTGTIGQGGVDSLSVTLAASGTFLVGFGLWSVARRRWSWR